MTGRIRFPLNPVHSIGWLFIAVLLGKIAPTNHLIPQLAFGVWAVFVPLFLVVSLLGVQKKPGASLLMFARVDETC